MKVIFYPAKQYLIEVSGSFSIFVSRQARMGRQRRRPQQQSMRHL
jgi:hypothetical protein